MQVLLGTERRYRLLWRLWQEEANLRGAQGPSEETSPCAEGEGKGGGGDEDSDDDSEGKGSGDDDSDDEDEDGEKEKEW